MQKISFLPDGAEAVRAAIASWRARGVQAYRYEGETALPVHDLFVVGWRIRF